MFGVVWQIVEDILRSTPHWLHVALHSVGHWSWGTIAAFTAAGTALWVAGAETRQRQLLLARQIVVELAHTCLDWNSEAAAFLGAVRKFLEGTGSAAEIDKQAIGFGEVCVAAAQKFMAGRLAFNDFELQRSIDEVENVVNQFLALLPRSSLDETPEQQQLRLNQMLEKGLPLLEDFLYKAEAVRRRGFEAYSPRRTARYRIAEWRFRASGGERLSAPPPIPIPRWSPPEAGATETHAEE